jgi:rod shape determining protein RodA
MKLGNNFLISKIRIFYIIDVFLLFGLLLFGKVINNARCWYIIPGVGNFQPSEFMKIILILYLSLICKKFMKKKVKTIKDELKLLLKVFVIVAIPSFITFLEPDTGAVLIYLVITISILFISGIRYRWFTITISILAIIVGLIIIIYSTNKDMFIKLLRTDFFLRVERLLDWKSGKGYQLTNSMIAIGSSGIIGKGSILLYYPEPQTDFIFASLASSIGFIGISLFIIITIIFDYLIIRCALKTNKDINQLIVAGIIGVLFFQQVQNISMTIGLLPIMGITLPFISYGGSSLISYMILIAIVLNIYNENNKMQNNIY